MHCKFYQNNLPDGACEKILLAFDIAGPTLSARSTSAVPDSGHLSWDDEDGKNGESLRLYLFICASRKRL